MRSVALISFPFAPPTRTQVFDESFSSDVRTERDHLTRHGAVLLSPNALRIRDIVALAVVTASLSCKADDISLPTAATNPLTDPSVAVAAHISAPRPLTPMDGAQIGEGQPTLTVENATITDDSTVTYHFEVATDSDFQTVVATGERIAPGEKETSWRVTPALEVAPPPWTG